MTVSILCDFLLVKTGGYSFSVGHNPTLSYAADGLSEQGIHVHIETKYLLTGLFITGLGIRGFSSDQRTGDMCTYIHSGYSDHYAILSCCWMSVVK